jgi:uncharacterized integral membrane protein
VAELAGNESEHGANAEPGGGAPASDPAAARTPEPPATPPTEPSGDGEGAQEPRHSLAEVARARRRRAAKAIGALLIFIVLVLFIVANSQPVEVNFLFFTAHPRLIWVMVTCSVLGGVLGYLLGRPGHEGKAKKRKEAPPPH